MPCACAARPARPKLAPSFEKTSRILGYRYRKLQKIVKLNSNLEFNCDLLLSSIMDAKIYPPVVAEVGPSVVVEPRAILELDALVGMPAAHACEDLGGYDAGLNYDPDLDVHTCDWDVSDSPKTVSYRIQSRVVDLDSAESIEFMCRIRDEQLSPFRSHIQELEGEVSDLKSRLSIAEKECVNRIRELDCQSSPRGLPFSPHPSMVHMSFSTAGQLASTCRRNAAYLRLFGLSFSLGNSSTLFSKPIRERIQQAVDKAQLEHLHISGADIAKEMMETTMSMVSHGSGPSLSKCYEEMIVDSASMIAMIALDSIRDGNA